MVYSGALERLQGPQPGTADAIAKVLDSPDTLAVLHALEMLEALPGRDFGPRVATLLDHPISSVRAAAARHNAPPAGESMPGIW